MSLYIKNSMERILPCNIISEENYALYLRHMFAYLYASKKLISYNVVLDIGFGEGYGADFLSQHVGVMIGLETDENVVRCTINKYGLDKCYYVLYNGVNLPFRAESFNGVVLFQVIEHIKKDNKMIDEINRIIKKGSVFFCTTPNKLYRMRNGKKPWNPFHEREYYSWELKHLLKLSFKNVKILGIRGNNEIQKMEINRVYYNKIFNFNIFNLMKYVPQPLVKLFTTYKKNKKANLHNMNLKYKLTDLHITKNANEGLDLLGVCRK